MRMNLVILEFVYILQIEEGMKISPELNFLAVLVMCADLTTEFTPFL
tara:strand:+ start:428 stop:568 length:141 start_codon:yes stop_codon:yes gene_type:complete